MAKLQEQETMLTQLSAAEDEGEQLHLGVDYEGAEVRSAIEFAEVRHARCMG